MKHSPPSFTVALAGNPNSGKTTVFNALTGLRQKVANYPGVTVEKKTGRCKLPDGRKINIIDLPGTYSLISRSPDEHVAMEVLRGLRSDTPPPDVVVVVVDASNLQRNLYLVSQLIEIGRPMVIALNMIDVAERRGISVNAVKLEEELGVPVIPIVGHKHTGVGELKHAITEAKVAPLPHWPLPQEMRDELLLVGGGLAILDSEDSTGIPLNAHGTRSVGSHIATLSHGASSVGVSNIPPRAWICGTDLDRRIDRYEALAERLLIGDRAPDIASIAHHEPVASLLSSATSRLQQLGIDPMQADVEAHYRWIDSVATLASQSVPVGEQAGAINYESRTLSYARGPHLSDRVDAILIHKFWGLLIFAVIMAGLFISIFWLATPVMEKFSGAIDWLGDKAVSGLTEGQPLHDLIKDGIFAGVGSVVVFVPQIALLFMFLAIMEDSGYLARAAFLMDRLLSKCGLHGKSFIPLLSSFACAIPGIMATRTIENRRDRLATIFVAPFMSCSARLPVYTLLIGTFFASYSALARGSFMLILYAIGIVAAVATAFLFKLGDKREAQTFILEMPSYKRPQVSQIARQVWTNSWAFLAKAGTTIFCLSVILWAMTYYPQLPPGRAEQIHQELYDAARPEKDMGFMWMSVPKAEVDKYIHEKKLAEADAGTDKAVAGERLRHSYAGRIGHVIEPVIKPLGFDWKMGVGLVGAFAAREVFVSTMGIVYSVGKDDENTEPLAAQMQSDTYPNGRKVWTPLVAVSLLVWFVLAMQCMSTIAIVKRETGGWKWPILMILYMNGVAYVGCLIVYQVGRIWFV